MSPAELQTLAQRARAALAQNSGYQYCELAPVLAHEEPDNGEWITGYIKALITLGLGAAANELATDLSRRFPADSAWSNLLAAIRQTPTGRVAWSTHRNRFEQNLRQLAKRDSQAADTIRNAWIANVRNYELHETRDANAQIRDRSTPGLLRWWPSLSDHRSTACNTINTDRVGILPPPLLFDGVGLGGDILSAYQQTHRVFLEASSAMYIVEPLPEAVAITFHLHDWSEPLADPRVQWFIGQGAANRFQRLVTDDVSWPLTDRVRHLPPLRQTNDEPATAALNSAAEVRMHIAQALQHDIAGQCANRDAHYWSERFAEAMNDDGRATSKPLRILALTSIHTTFLQYSMRDCLRAMERLGHETKLLIETASHRCLDTIEVLRAQRDFQPDLVILLSRMRYEMRNLIHEAVPSVTWDQDALPWVFDPARKPQLAWNDFLVGYAASTAHRKFNWPKHRLMFCPMAGSPDTYSAEPVAECELEPYLCDVSYVSHASATPDREMPHAESWLAEERLRTLFRAVAPIAVPNWYAGSEFPGTLTSTIIDTAAKLAMPLTPDDIHKVTVALCRIGDRAFRHVALEWIADWADRTGRTLHLWGNGWENHPRLARYAKGPTANGHALRCVYQASRINLQLMGYGFLHQRAIDGLMASAFFMARRAGADTQGPALRELVRLLDEHNVNCAASLARVTDPVIRQRLDRLLLERNADPRALSAEDIDGWRSNVPNAFADEIIPHFREITFTSPEEFASLAERFLHEPETRKTYAAQMRQTLIDRYSYDARMRDMLNFIRKGFQIESECQRPSNVDTSVSLAPSII